MTSNETTPQSAERRLTDLIDRWKIDHYPADGLMPAVEELPAFLSDIDTVLRDLRQERSGHIGTINERDQAQDAADKLAYAIAPMEVIGEHSSGNDPWAQALEVLLERPDLTRKALNEATALNGVHERVIARLRADLEQARLAPGPTGLTRVWSGYDDDECWFPQFTRLADAQAYAEAVFRAQCDALDAGEVGEITWTERTARTEAVGYPDMFDLQSGVGGDGWVVCGVLVHPDLASGLREMAIETAEDKAEYAQATGSGDGEPCRPCGGQGFRYTPGGEETVDCMLCGGTGVAGEKAAAVHGTTDTDTKD